MLNLAGERRDNRRNARHAGTATRWRRATRDRPFVRFFVDCFFFLVCMNVFRRTLFIFPVMITRRSCVPAPHGTAAGCDIDVPYLSIRSNTVRITGVRASVRMHCLGHILVGYSTYPAGRFSILSGTETCPAGIRCILYVEIYSFFFASVKLSVEIHLLDPAPDRLSVPVQQVGSVTTNASRTVSFNDRTVIELFRHRRLR